MVSVKRTHDGIEITRKALGLAITAITLIGILLGTTAAGVRAIDQLHATATKMELQDSIRVIRQADSTLHAMEALHEAKQDSAISLYGRQTLGLLCSKYG